MLPQCTAADIDAPRKFLLIENFTSDFHVSLNYTLTARLSRLGTAKHSGKDVVLLTYYDSTLGRERFKRRYVWAAWAFVAGIVLGVVIAKMA